MMRRLSGQGIILIAILVTALALRLVPVVREPIKIVKKDAMHYDDIAVNLLNGNGFSLSDKHLLPGDRVPSGKPRPTARRPLLYPVFLALVYKIFGRNFAAVGVVQSLVSVLTCYLIYLFTAGICGRKSIGLIAAGISAVYLPFIGFANALLTETLFLFLIIVTFDFMFRAVKKERILWAALAGLLSAISFLCRPTAVGLPVVFLLLLFAGRRFGLRRRALLRGSIYLLAFLVIYFGWVARNYRVFGTFVPGFTSAGYNLFLGSYPPARGRPNIPLDEHPEDLRRKLEGKGEIEANRIFTQAAIENVREHPGAFLELMMMKLIRGWFKVPVGHDWLPSARSLIVNGLIVVFAFAGFLVLLKRDVFSAVFLASPIVYFTGFHALVVSSTRYNLPSFPFAIILLSVALDRIASKIRNE